MTGLANQSAVEGASASFNLGSFNDPDDGPWSVDVNWGDGATLSIDPVVPGSYTPQSHTYAEEGTEDGHRHGHRLSAACRGPGTFQVTVSDPAVMAAGGFLVTAVEGADSGSQTVATFTDPGGAEPLADYSALINWGDGTPASVGSISSAGGVFTVKGNHTYAEESSRRAPRLQPVRRRGHHQPRGGPDGGRPQQRRRLRPGGDPTGGRGHAVEGIGHRARDGGDVHRPGRAGTDGRLLGRDRLGRRDGHDRRDHQLRRRRLHRHRQPHLRRGERRRPPGLQPVRDHRHDQPRDGARRRRPQHGRRVRPGGDRRPAGSRSSRSRASLSAVQTVATFTDPGGAEPLATTRPSIDWGDGTAATRRARITFAGGVFTVTGQPHVRRRPRASRATSATPSATPTRRRTTSRSPSRSATRTPRRPQAVSDAKISIKPGTAHLTNLGSLIVVGTPGDDTIVLNNVGGRHADGHRAARLEQSWARSPSSAGRADRRGGDGRQRQRPGGRRYPRRRRSCTVAPATTGSRAAAGGTSWSAATGTTR